MSEAAFISGPIVLGFVPTQGHAWKDLVIHLSFVHYSDDNLVI